MKWRLLFLITSIYIASHKEYWVPSFEEYKPIHVGAANTDNRFVEICDNTGVAISDKNKNYCELTGLYWIWKNDLTSDIVGLCHYRRYFDFKDSQNIFIRQLIADKNFKNYLNDFINPVKVEHYLKDADIVLPIQHELGCSMQEQYCNDHIANDFYVAKEVIADLYPEYKESMEYVFGCKWIYLYNMFIMKKSVFNNYMEWLFNILFEVEKKITISTDPYQARVFGFLAERLLNVYVYHNKLKIKEVPIVFIDDNNNQKKHKHKKLKYFVRNLL